MIGYITIRERGPTPGITKSEQGDIIRDVLAHTAANHHAKFMHRHFTHDAKRIYGYKPRKGEGKSGKEFWTSYTGRKNKVKGHMKPLVWSGVSQTLAKIRDVRSNRNRAVLVQHARGLNRRNPNSEINMVEEIRTVAEGEAREAYRMVDSLFRKRVREIRITKTTRV